MSVGQNGSLKTWVMTQPPGVYWDEPQAACLQLMPRPRWSTSRQSRPPSMDTGQSVGIRRLQYIVWTRCLILPPWRRQQRHPSPAVCLSHAPYTADGTITRDGVAAAAGRGRYLTATVKVVYFQVLTSGFKFRLSIINRLYTIDYRLWKKFESSILSYVLEESTDLWHYQLYSPPLLVITDVILLNVFSALPITPDL